MICITVGYKGCVEFISEEFFWEIFRNEDFGYTFLEKGHILMPFSGIATKKNVNFVNKFKGRI